MYAVLEKLPTPNYDLLERLMFHLATYDHFSLHVKRFREFAINAIVSL